MPLTIEDKVENHRVARERIANGRPVWDRTVNIKAILNRDPANNSEAYAATVANEIAALLRARLPAALFDITSDGYDISLDEAVEDLGSLTPESFADDPEYSVIQALNGRLDEIYDWADRARVWLGP